MIFSQLRYPDDLVQTTIRRVIESKLSEDSDTRLAYKREAPVRIVLPYKDQKSANVVRKQLAELSRNINTDISPGWNKGKWRQAASCDSTMRSAFISVCPVRCRLCRLHVSAPKPTNWRIQKIGNWKPPQSAAGNLARRHRSEFSNLKKVSQQIWLFYFWNVFSSQSWNQR